jgi:hypothetical protein
LSHRYCYPPLSWKSWNRFECAVGGVCHPQRTQTRVVWIHQNAAYHCGTFIILRVAAISRRFATIYTPLNKVALSRLLYRCLTRALSISSCPRAPKPAPSSSHVFAFKVLMGLFPQLANAIC